MENPIHINSEITGDILHDLATRLNKCKKYCVIIYNEMFVYK